MKNLGKKFGKKRCVAISWMCLLALTISIFAAMPPKSVEASAANFTQAQAVTWINAQVGKSLDYDKAFGAQCVDLIKFYYAYLGVPVANGNAWEYNTSTAPRCPSGWTRVTSNPQPGDVIVWPANATWGSYGHIGLITAVNGTSLTTLEQNVDGTPATGGPARVRTRSTTGTTAPVCYLRPNFKAAIQTFTIKYNSNGGSGTMADQIIVYGESTKTRSNTFTRSGFEFDCWFIRRSSDNKWRYRSSDGLSSGWYTEGSQPVNWGKYRYNNAGSVSTTVSAGNTVTFFAQWIPAGQPKVTYSAHIQEVGDTIFLNVPDVIGTQGQALRLEQLTIRTNIGTIRAQGHIQDLGDSAVVSGSQVSIGTIAQQRRMESISLRLDGVTGFALRYRVHQAHIGWSDWFEQGAWAGVKGQSRQIEAVQIQVVQR